MHGDDLRSVGIEHGDFWFYLLTVRDVGDQFYLWGVINMILTVAARIVARDIMQECRDDDGSV